MAPKAKSFVNERDLWDFYFSAGKCMHKAFLEDVRSMDDSANTTGEAGAAHDTVMEGEPGDCQEQETYGRIKRKRGLEGGSLGAPLRSSSVVGEPAKRRGRRDPPPAGAAMKACVEDTLPEMTSLLAAIERWMRPETINSFMGAGFSWCSCIYALSVVVGRKSRSHNTRCTSSHSLLV